MVEKSRGVDDHKCTGKTRDVNNYVELKNHVVLKGRDGLAGRGRFLNGVIVRMGLKPHKGWSGRVCCWRK